MRNKIRWLFVFFCFSVMANFPGVAQVRPSKLAVDIDLSAKLKEAESDSQEQARLYKLGGKVASFCANCHGKGGNSALSDVPNLAGQNQAYLLEQMRQYSDGRRTDIFMGPMIKALNADEKVGVVIFYAKQEVAHKSATDLALLQKGENYYRKICFTCHGSAGRGDDTIARIAGQQIDYLNLTLKRYRDGSLVRTNARMAESTRLMTDADIAAVSAYISAMK